LHLFDTLAVRRTQQSTTTGKSRKDSLPNRTMHGIPFILSSRLNYGFEPDTLGVLR
jgi:hypothetical protein